MSDPEYLRLRRYAIEGRDLLTDSTLCAFHSQRNSRYLEGYQAPPSRFATSAQSGEFHESPAQPARGAQARVERSPYGARVPLHRAGADLRLRRRDLGV